MRRPSPAPVPPAVDRWTALVAYDGPARELIAQLKYRNRRAALSWLAAGMAALVSSWVDIAGPDLVTWAPTSPDRVRRRGFDQAELLAFAVARRLGVPCGRLLVRLPGPPQTGRSRSERWCLPRFAAAPGRAPPSVLLVDDIATTGATLAAAARALRGAGVEQVTAVVAGRRS